MEITAPFVLPTDLELIPVAELAPALRERFKASAGDVAVSRPAARTPSRIVDAAAATLLEEFRQPTTIVEAVIRYGKVAGDNPAELLEGAFPLLRQLIGARFLVPAGDAAATATAAGYRPGDAIGDWTILRVAHLLDDTELYQAEDAAGGRVALKIARDPDGRGAAALLAREAAILRRLDGAVGPRLLGEGTTDGRPYLAIEWREGVTADVAAEERRRLPAAGRRAALLALGEAILTRYVALHEAGLLHGDIHPGNIIVADDDTVHLIDFGLAQMLDAAPGPKRLARGGVGFFLEPELARARLAGAATPADTPAAEQYRLAALLYLLLTGVHYLSFSLEPQELYRQIAGDPPEPFARHGQAPWAEVEAVLARALQKEPGDRFPSVAAFAARWRAVAAPTPPAPARAAAAPREFVAEYLARVGPGSPLLARGLTVAPVAPLAHGTAGVAYGLYRMAGQRDDAGLLALAELWSQRAVAASAEPLAFLSPDDGLTAESVGPISPHLSATGVHATRALLARSRGDVPGEQEALAAFLADAEAPWDELELMTGRAGLLLATTLLLDPAALPDSGGNAPLRGLGDRLARGVWETLDRLPAVDGCTGPFGYLGMAHGWAGPLYATLRWHAATGGTTPPQLGERLAQLAACATRDEHGRCWPVGGAAAGQHLRGALPGWCHGSAGYVHLWTAAHRALGGDEYLMLAEQAAEHTWRATAAAAGLCCGLGGRAYALLDFSHHGGSSVWLRRAEDLAMRASRAARDPRDGADLIHPDSLLKGDLGIAVLLVDLEQPATAARPFFGEAW